MDSTPDSTTTGGPSGTISSNNSTEISNEAFKMSKLKVIYKGVLPTGWVQLDLLVRNPTIFNIICWVSGLIVSSTKHLIVQVSF